MSPSANKAACKSLQCQSTPGKRYKSFKMTAVKTKLCWRQGVASNLLRRDGRKFLTKIEPHGAPIQAVKELMNFSLDALMRCTTQHNLLKRAPSTSFFVHHTADSHRWKHKRNVVCLASASTKKCHHRGGRGPGATLPIARDLSFAAVTRAHRMASPRYSLLQATASLFLEFQPIPELWLSPISCLILT